MKKFDCFPFFNELELLHLRFMEYYDCVDYFVLVESDKSHTGKPKPLFYKENKELFQNFNDKVIHIIVNDLPDYSANNIWIAENFQRNCIMRGLEGKAIAGDKIFISDCDELWDTDMAQLCLHRNVTFTHDLYYYYVNCKQNCTWYGSMMTTYGQFGTPQDVRNQARGGINTVGPGGWHYSFMGGAEKIKEKVENIAESHMIINQVGDVNEIKTKMESSSDLWGRADTYAKKSFIQLGYAPKSIYKFLEIYPNFYKKI